jgi:hypothetical protein
LPTSNRAERQAQGQIIFDQKLSPEGGTTVSQQQAGTTKTFKVYLFSLSVLLHSAVLLFQNAIAESFIV